MEMMNEALKRRKGRGVDIAIVLGDETPLNMTTPQGVGEESEVDEAAEAEELGLAPEAKEEGADVHEDAEMDKEMLMQMLGRNSLLSRAKK
jgi:hypothetical protein